MTTDVTAVTPPPAGDYPVRYSVEYPEGPRNRLTVLVRLILAIPILILFGALASGGGTGWGGGGGGGDRMDDRMGGGMGGRMGGQFEGRAFDAAPGPLRDLARDELSQQALGVGLQAVIRLTAVLPLVICAWWQFPAQLPCVLASVAYSADRHRTPSHVRHAPRRGDA